MKRVTFVLFFCIGIFAGSYSQTKQESIKELIHLMKNDSAAIKVVNSMLPMLEKKMSQEMDSTAKAKTKESMKVAMESVKKIINLVREDKAKLYDQHFTQKEIDEMIVFYKSPVGRKYVSETPEITKELVIKVVKDYLPEMQKAMKAKKAEQKGSDNDE
jgi:uncharacterized protein